MSVASDGYCMDFLSSVPMTSVGKGGLRFTSIAHLLSPHDLSVQPRDLSLSVSRTRVWFCLTVLCKRIALGKMRARGDSDPIFRVHVITVEMTTVPMLHATA